MKLAYGQETYTIESHFTATPRLLGNPLYRFVVALNWTNSFECMYQTHHLIFQNAFLGLMQIS
jgi:hypothetical protein